MFKKFINKIKAWFINHRKKEEDYESKENSYGVNTSTVIYTNNYHEWPGEIAYTDSNIIIMLRLNPEFNISHIYKCFNMLDFRWIPLFTEVNNIIFIAGSIQQYQELILTLDCKYNESMMVKLLIDALRDVDHNGFYYNFMEKYNINSSNPIGSIKNINIDYNEPENDPNVDTGKIIDFDDPIAFLPVSELDNLTYKDKLYLGTIEYIDDDHNFWNNPIINIIETACLEYDTDMYLPDKVIAELCEFITDSGNNETIGDRLEVYRQFTLTEGFDTFVNKYNENLYENIDEVLE